MRDYPKYRAINGDGNCFYRAMAFLYLRESDLSRFENVFKSVELRCSNFPVEIEKNEFDEVLREMHKTFLRPISGIRSKREKEG